MTSPDSNTVPDGKVFMSDEKWDLLAQLAEDSDYWNTAQDFAKQVHGRELSSMSDKQVYWFQNSEAALGREFYYREAKEAFGADSEQAKRAFDGLYGENARGRRRVG